MTKTRQLIWVMALIWLTMAAASLGQAALKDESEYPKECVAEFKNLDKDENGQVTLEEYVIAAQPSTYAGRKLAKETFVRMDKNGNEVLTLDEYCVVEEVKEGEQPPTKEEQCEEMFKKYDTDGDGKLTVTEFVVGTQATTFGSRKASRDTFLLMDKNHDDLLSREEFCADMQQKPPEE